MLRKTISYTDYNGEECTEDFYFNLTRAELVEIEMGHQGGLQASIEKLIETNDGGTIMEEFKKIILKAYGKRSPDGKRFIKNQELRDEFESTEAYSVLFMELVTDAEEAAKFVSSLVPSDLMKEAQLKMEAPKPDAAYIPPAEPREITRAEAEAMDAAELQAGLASQSIVIAPPYQDPQALTEADVINMDPADLARGLSSGRYQIASRQE